MAAKFIIPVIGAFFLVLACVRFMKDGGRIKPASKAWFLVGGIFSAVGFWLWVR